MTHGIFGVLTAQGIVVRHAPPRRTQVHTHPVTAVQLQQQHPTVTFLYVGRIVVVLTANHLCSAENL